MFLIVFHMFSWCCCHSAVCPDCDCSPSLWKNSPWTSPLMMWKSSPMSRLMLSRWVCLLATTTLLWESVVYFSDSQNSCELMPLSLMNKHEFMLPGAPVCMWSSSDNNNLLSQLVVQLIWLNMFLLFLFVFFQAYFADGNKVRCHTNN